MTTLMTSLPDCVTLTIKQNKDLLTKVMMVYARNTM